MSNGLDQELGDVLTDVEQARASVASHDLLRAAQALITVQDRVGRILREMSCAERRPWMERASNRTGCKNDWLTRN